jgi:hypothetical protein
MSTPQQAQNAWDWPVMLVWVEWAHIVAKEYRGKEIKR